MRKFLAGLILGLLLLAPAAFAIPADIPGDAIINPATETIYFPDNRADARIMVYRKSGSTWTAATPIALPRTAKCYGMAVTTDGNSLFVSVSLGGSSEIRRYPLATGLPDSLTYTSMDMGSGRWYAASNPTGLEIQGNRLFAVDKGTGRVLVFNTSTNRYITSFNEGLAGTTTAYGIEVYAAGKTNYKVYVTTLTSPGGQIHVYNYNPLTDTVSSHSTVAGTFYYPSYIKYSHSRIYVAVNGASGGDIKVINPATDAVVATVSSGVNFSYGWTGFDFNSDGSNLYFKHALNAGETSNWFYSVSTSGLSGSVTAASLEGISSALPADGMTLALTGHGTAITNSRTGSIEILSSLYPPLNNPPTIDPRTLQQYRLDGTVIEPGGTTTDNRIRVSFIPNDANATDSLTALVWFGPLGSTVPGGSHTEVVIDGITPGSTVTAELPAVGTFANGEYEWCVWRVRDNHGADTGGRASFNGDGIDFVVAVPPAHTATPDAFSKITPAHGSSVVGVNGSTTLSWTPSADRDGPNPLSYRVTVSEYGDSGGPFIDQTIADPTAVSYTIPAGRLRNNTRYIWSVAALDGENIIWADGQSGSRGAGFTFTYLEGENPAGAPQLEETIPDHNRTGVALNAPIIIYFTKSMQTAPVEGAVSITPAVAGATYSWNPIQTRLTINHADFTPGTAYTVAVGAAAVDLSGTALAAGIVPNPFTFTTTGGGATDVISSINIAREGSDVVVTWTTDPAGTGVDIYRLTCNTDASGNYTSYFTTEVSAWGARIKTNDTSGRLEIANAVGTGNAQYFKLIRTGTALTPADLTSEVVGKFDVAVGPADTQPERACISLPLQLSDYAIANAFGTQASEADSISIIDNNYAIVRGMNFEGGSWVAITGVPALDTLAQGDAYVYSSLTSKFITVTGRVKELPTPIDLVTGLDIAGQYIPDWIGNQYPAFAPIGNAALNGTSFGPDALSASSVILLDANAAVLGYAEHRAADSWVDSDGAASSLRLLPGKGYVIIDPVRASYRWTQTRPY